MNEINRFQLQALRAQGGQLVEVLPADEYLEEHIAGAINLPLKNLDRETAGQLSPNLPVITYCYDYQ